MVSHGYIKHDFDVHEWAAPEFLEQAAEELLEEEWTKRSTAKLPEATQLEISTHPARLTIPKEHDVTKTAVELIIDGQGAASAAVAPKDAADELATGTSVFVDVREAEEWQHGHIDGSVPAPRGLLEFFADPTSPRHKEALDPDRRVDRGVRVGSACGTRGGHAPRHGLRERRRARRRPQGMDGRRTADQRARVLRHLSVSLASRKVRASPRASRVERFGEGVCARSRQHRYGEQPEVDDPEGEDQLGERAQSSGCLIGSCDLGNPGFVQGGPRDWRRERDSNPRRLAPQRFSRPSRSAAPAPLRAPGYGERTRQARGSTRSKPVKGRSTSGTTNAPSSSW